MENKGKSIADLIKFAMQNPKPILVNENVPTQIMQFFSRKTGYYANDLHVSNSFINHVISCEFGTQAFAFVPQEAIEKAFAFGTDFENLLFEEPLVKDLYLEDYEKMSNMIQGFELPKEKFLRDKELRGLYLYNDKYIRIKGKIDLFLSDTIVDIKTTNSTTEYAFRKACKSFGYYSQGFLYNYLCPFQKFEIWAFVKKIVGNEYRKIKIVFNQTDFEQGKNRFEEGLAILDKYNLLQDFSE